MVVCIAVRMNSSRLPNKALAYLVEGNTVLELLIKRISAFVDTSQIILCTTNYVIDDPLVHLATSLGISSFRGDAMDVMSRFIGATAQLDDCRNIIRVTGDNPLTDPLFMCKMANYHCMESADYTFTNQIPRGTRCEIIGKEFLSSLHRQIIDRSKTEYMTYYLKRDFGQKRCEFFDQYLSPISCHNLTVDTLEDLRYLQCLFRNFSDPVHVPLSEIVSYINENKLTRMLADNCFPHQIDSLYAVASDFTYSTSNRLNMNCNA